MPLFSLARGREEGSREKQLGGKENIMSETLMEVRHLKKYFETPKGMLHAVDDVTFSIGRGKTMGVVGESGCGKSTLGRTLIHLYESTDGQILFNGEDITHVTKCDKPDRMTWRRRSEKT